ncbi:4-phosphopantetheinyl transferase [Bacteriovorax stolpii]|uniref:4'-phosphopantetheinyl transferase family protein n=1 Tax=Bacteriovorax stolpii TaxID=960 RepID=UPI001158B93A|nr:4'-phosphopantetheinyl transferase superfamily protein [Bacteriovorax stolpii]QDK40843.1 4-phosphopantetheinyl transferase [Bacteriovorax stolpii]
MKNPWSHLFLRSSFFALKKEEDLDTSLKIEHSKLQYDSAVNGFHPKRKDEFLLGRLCAAKAFYECTKQPLYDLKNNPDRSPAWPSGVVGTISHNEFWVGAAVAKDTDLLGVGMDFEVMGRTKLELAKQIRSGGDLLSHPQLSDEELLTLIFSAKESLYKALYPQVKKFFGFEDASVTKIDLDNGTFVINLISDLNLNFGPKSRFSFEGRFTVDNKTCLTVLELSH